MDRTRALAGLIEQARSAGAQGAEALATEIESFHATAARAKVQRAAASQHDQLVVRVWLTDGRRGETEGALDQGADLLGRALERARKAKPEPSAGPVGRSAAEGQTSDVDDRRYAALGREDRLDVLVTAERVARAVDRELELSGFAYRDERAVRTLVNSRGLRLTEASTVFRVEGVVGDAKLGISLSDVVEDRAFATVASLPFGASLGRRLLELRGTPTTWSGPVRVMLPPRVVAEIFGLLAPHFRLRDLQAGSSFLSRARSGGDLVLSPRLHVVDDGLLSGALNSRSFDDHGVSPVALTLLRDGQVDGWYMDLDEARARDVRPTGHVRDGRLEPSNLVVGGGSRSMNALLAEQPEPVVVLDHVRGLDRGLDVKTGRLRCEGSGRLVVPRNDTRGWLPRMTLEGDLTQVLARIVDLASDTDRHGHIDAPGMLVDGFTVS